ncbi:hypothetical protein AQ837_08145 [Burkholderia pseudomallei]|nr:hypothetical protein SZ29_20120 [Burkholderia pseudomallei]OMX03021.1 hypothetical protein AQ819_09090 [Burkholderia pseudomallei]OMY09166.1 hypothetical protein AQ837_08145 [Burkholderia pseudomallei]OMY12073.1 hypothetical protein AQ838_10630 [Burkholderia pseudomallei]OMY22163.1 hypothetical protein AQ839_15530 [Burkholderia pseudomallei]
MPRARGNRPPFEVAVRDARPPYAVASRDSPAGGAYGTKHALQRASRAMRSSGERVPPAAASRRASRRAPAARDAA